MEKQLLSVSASKVVSTGGDGVLMLAQREYKILTYQSLQPRLDFKERGVTKLRNYFYREDSIMIWDVIQRYVHHLGEAYMNVLDLMYLVIILLRDFLILKYSSCTLAGVILANSLWPLWPCDA